MTEAYPKQGQYQQIVKAKIIIDDHYADKLDLESLAHYAHFSKFHFVRLFKNIYGITPLQYLIQVRLEKAKFLIANDMSISAACWQVGFESVSTFMGLFKEKTGITSSVFKNEQERFKKLIKDKPTRHIPSCLIRRL